MYSYISQENTTHFDKKVSNDNHFLINLKLLQVIKSSTLLCLKQQSKF